jgi:hypothetical protein
MVQLLFSEQKGKGIMHIMHWNAHQQISMQGITRTQNTI